MDNFVDHPSPQSDSYLSIHPGILTLMSATPTLYTVATAHLDTQWRWTFRETITDFLPATVDGNLRLFEIFPHYTFSFEGAFRYMLLEEYYPDRFAKVSAAVAAGRWALAGSVIDTGDVNTVSMESLFRQVFYGNRYYREKFGRDCVEIMLPDCFGFSWALPSVCAHCGLLGFNTSKLDWGSCIGKPFNVGVWEGPDGGALIAAINPGQYSLPIEDRIDPSEQWRERLSAMGEQCGHPVDFKYFGLGDTGGAPDDQSVTLLEDAIAADGPFTVRSADVGDFFREFPTEAISQLERHRSEFLLIEHGAGTYTANGAMKRMNRQNEILANAAEVLATMADTMGLMPYPSEKIHRAWIRVLANQMHDILPGSSIPEAYRFAYHDEAIARNEFIDVIEAAVRVIGGDVAPEEGYTVVVFNPADDMVSGRVRVRLPYRRTDQLIAEGAHHSRKPLRWVADDIFEFEASIYGFGVSVFVIKHEQQTRPAEAYNEDLVLENEFLRVEFLESGQIDKLIERETGLNVFREPMRFDLLRTAPREWPAWTIIYDDLCQKPLAELSGMAHRIDRECIRAVLRNANSCLSIVYRLGEESRELEMECLLRWETPGAMLKAVFPLSFENEHANYDIGAAYIQRPTNSESKHEVPALGTANLTSREGAVGLSIFSDCKYGWDKPDASTLRHTLIHTPEPQGFECHLGGLDLIDHFEEQFQLDFGHHRFRLALRPHAGAFDPVKTRKALRQFETPLLGFYVPPGKGINSAALSMIQSVTNSLEITALKKAEDGSDRIIVRNQNITNHQVSMRHFRSPITSASLQECDGQERPIDKGAVNRDYQPYEWRTFSVQAPERELPSHPEFLPLELPFNINGISPNECRRDGDFDGLGHSLPAELLGDAIQNELGVFPIGSSEYGKKNCLVPLGQELALPANHGGGQFLMIGASVRGTVHTRFKIDDSEVCLTFRDWRQQLGNWTDRAPDGVYRNEVRHMALPYLDRARLAWVGTHLHSKASATDLVYEKSFLYSYLLPLPSTAQAVTLPVAPSIRILVMGVWKSERPIPQFTEDAFPLFPSPDEIKLVDTLVNLERPK